MDYFDILFAKTNGISSSSCYNEIEAMLEATVGHSGKNLLELSGTSGTTSGVNFTIDKISGIVTTANTSTGQVIKIIGEVTNNSDTAKNYWLSGGADNGASNSYYLYAIDANTDTRPKQWDGVTNSLASYGLNDSVQIQIPVGHKIKVQILVRNGVNTDGLVFKPMFREASISDDTFEPYVTPTDEKKQDKTVVLWEAALNSTGVSDVPISSLADNVSNYPYLKVVVTNEGETTITDQDAVMTTAEYDTAYIGREVAVSVAMLGKHLENGVLVFDRLFIWVYSEGTNISVRGLRNHNDTSTPPDVLPSVFIRKIIGIPK